ncbi:MAG: 30S ribosomal protein S4 [Actinomycetes bacterium]
MARYTGPDCRLCRREKTKLFLKGSKCESPKCPVEKRPYPPGEHGRGRLKESEYNLQLREKQKARRIYGILEKQFHNYYVEAARRKGITGETLLQLLETRLDNVVYRGGLARSRDQARQLVRHSHVTVNGKKVNIPSYQVKPGDVVQVKERMRQNLNVHESIQLQTGRPQPGWLELNAGEARLTVNRIPSRDQVEVPIQEQLIVELYSK